jgi:hypothetical protein
MARLPHEYNTWLGYGHTVPNGDPPEAFASGTDLCGWILLPPFLSLSKDFFELRISDEKTIHFFALWPLHEDEMNLKLRKGADALLERFEAHGVTEVIQAARATTCEPRKRRWFFGR